MKLPLIIIWNLLQRSIIMHYSLVVIILFNTDLYKSAFPTYSFKNLVFDLSVFCIFCLLCFEFGVIISKKLLTFV